MLAESTPDVDAGDGGCGRRRRRCWSAALAGYWALLFTATHIPATEFVAHAMELNADKVVHFVAYAVLAALLLQTLRAHGVRWASGLTLLIAIAYGAIDELTQPLVNRVCDPLDFAANVVGVGLAVGVARWFRR